MNLHCVTLDEQYWNHPVIRVQEDAPTSLQDLNKRVGLRNFLTYWTYIDDKHRPICIRNTKHLERALRLAAGRKEFCLWEGCGRASAINHTDAKCCPC